MEFVIIFLLGLIILDCILNIIYSFKVHRLIRYFDYTVRDYLNVYKSLQGVWNTDYDAEMIMEVCNLENNLLKFGFIKLMSYQNARELRENMLLIGEFIIEYSESLKIHFDYQVNDEEYNSSLEVLKEIRSICIQKGERATVNRNDNN